MKNTVLVLNASYEEHGRVTVSRAATMLYLRKAVVETSVPGRAFGPYPYPEVLRLVRYVHPTWRYRRRDVPGGRITSTGVKDVWTPVDETATFSFPGVIARDHRQCCFCGKPEHLVEEPPPGTPRLTVDHVLPRAQGGGSTWENCVAACWRCNWDKADRTPEQAGLRMLWQPFVPTRYDLTWGS